MCVCVLGVLGLLSVLEFLFVDNLVIHKSAIFHPGRPYTEDGQHLAIFRKTERNMRKGRKQTKKKEKKNATPRREHRYFQIIPLVANSLQLKFSAISANYPCFSVLFNVNGTTPPSPFSC